MALRTDRESRSLSSSINARTGHWGARGLVVAVMARVETEVRSRRTAQGKGLSRVAGETECETSEIRGVTTPGERTILVRQDQHASVW